MKPSAEARQRILSQLLERHWLGQCTQGELLRHVRKQVLALNQTQYANLVGVSRRTLSDIEQDKASVTQAGIEKVFKPLGLKAGLVPLQAKIAQQLLRDMSLLESEKNS